MLRFFVPVMTALFLSVSGLRAESAPQAGSPQEVADQIDAFLTAHWQQNGVTPSERTSDPAFLRRVSLDLLGRVPTYDEAFQFAQDDAEDKREQLILRLIASPESPLHLGTVLDGVIQGPNAGNREFVAYLRSRLADGAAWDALFREIVAGPWESEAQKPARRFVADRIRNLDDLTSDTARVFFGVEIACAKCHDHPLVLDWTQHHYYGMQAFFNRSYAKGNGASEQLLEKDKGEVMFVDRTGEEHTADAMFLSGRVVKEPNLQLDPRLQDRKKQAEKDGTYLPPAFSRREQLVRVALEQREFFSRAVVNQVWNYVFGQGLVDPIDQMHSENPPSVDGVLEWLADDLADHGYDLKRLVEGIVRSRTYQLSSRWLSADDPPAPGHFAVAQVRPLTPGQFAFSLALVTGDGTYKKAADAEARRKAYEVIERRVAGLTSYLDPRTARPESTTTEALFLSNNEEIAGFLKPAGGNLVERLAAIEDTNQLVETAVWTVLSRPPDAEEQVLLHEWIDSRGENRAGACSQLVWSLVASAEFRFNY
jgi:hypothetical protein